MAGKIFLICLILPILIAFENLILIKKKTMPVVFCDQVVWSLGAYLAVTKLAPDIKYRIIVGVACGALFLFLCFIKFKIHQSEGADLDYSDRIFSLMAPINKLIKPKNMAMGRILPVNHNELIYNMRCLDLDDVILSGATLITGSTGSGKNLHKDTLIPTTEGMKTIGEVKVGDIVFDDEGKQTKVIDKYSPNETSFYEITFSDGTTVRAGGGHLWKVERLDKRVPRGNIQVDFSNVDLDCLKNCIIDAPITKQAFIEKYLNADNNYRKWDIFLNNHFKGLSYRMSNDFRYIDTDVVLKYAQGHSHNEKRIERIKQFQKDTKQTLMSNNEAKRVLTEGHWDDVIRKAGITKIDRLNLYYNEKDLCTALYNCFYVLKTWVNHTRPIEVIDTNEIAMTGIKGKYDRTNFAVMKAGACEYNKIKLPIEPYWLGAWLGDGIADRQVICGVDQEIADRANLDYPIESIYRETKQNSKLTYWNFGKSVRHLLQKNNLQSNKHIPEIYLQATISDKLELIAGLMDTDGYVDKKGTCILQMTNKQIIESIRAICCSLGFDCRAIGTKQGTYTKNGEKIMCKEVYTLTFYPNCVIPLQVPRKRQSLIAGIESRKQATQQIRHKRLYITDIKPIQGVSKDYFCLAVDSETHMFLCTSSYIPTHNTTTMKTVLKQRIDQRKPVVFFDYKGEEDILDDIKGYAEQAGLPYYEFSARDCTFNYDPFTNLNETGKVEALMNTRRWSMDGADEHYKTSMQLAIQNLVRAYDNYREEKGETCNYIVGLYAFAESYHPEMNERDGFNNLKKSLEILLTSRAKDLFGDDPDFTFERDEPYVICFSFPSANKQLANNLSSFVFTDLMDRGTRRHYPNKLLLCVDEFGTLESSTLIKDLLEKGRSGGVQTVFSILDVNQIAMNSGEYFVNAILGTINNYIIHAGATQTTAELLAGVQKFDKSFDIMSLRKPYKGKKPTALFISKYPIFSKKGNQEVYRMIPYTSVLKKAIAKPKIDFPKPKDEDEDDEKNYKPIEDEIQSPTYEDEEPPKKELNPDDVDWTKPIDNIEDWL